MMSHDPLVEFQADIYHRTRKAARPVGDLLPCVLHRDSLVSAWRRVSSNAGAETPGVDGATCRDIAPRVGSWLAQLADELAGGSYQPRAPRWINVPKRRGSPATRRLGILSVRDRVVHTAVKAVLEPVLEPAFSPSSFGFRPGRSVPVALHEATRRLGHRAEQPPPYRYAAHLDVAECFDSLDHHLLLETLRQHVADCELLALVARLLAAGGHRVRGWWRTRECGAVQGSALSPLLCNLYLDTLDKQLDQRQAATHGAIGGLRYADDLLLMGRDRGAARQGIALVRRALAGRRLHLRRRRPRAARVDQGVHWLGVIIRPRGTSFNGLVPFGYVVPDQKVRDLLATVDEMTEPPSQRLAPDSVNLGRWLFSLNEQLRQWREAYVFADNAVEVFRAVDDHARHRVGRLLRRVRGGRGASALDGCRVRLPRGFWTWRADGAQLVVLSALAPRCPQPQARKPAWQKKQRGRPPSAGQRKSSQHNS